jgi:hypothetical protein
MCYFVFISRRPHQKLVELTELTAAAARLQAAAPPTASDVDPALALALDTRAALAWAAPLGRVVTVSASAAHCTLTGDGASRATLTQRAAATLTLRDADNRPVASTAVVLPLVQVAWLVGAAGEVIDEEAQRDCAVRVEAGENGQAMLSYTWPEGSVVGPRRLRVTISGRPIAGSPFTVHVEPQVSAAHCTLTGDGASRAFSGYPATATLTLRDALNRPVAAAVRASALPLLRAVWLAGAAGDAIDEAATRATEVNLAPGEGEGEVMLRYTWPAGTMAGPRRLGVTLSEVPLAGSPWTVHVALPVPVCITVVCRWIFFIFIIFIIFVVFLCDG